MNMLMNRGAGLTGHDFCRSLLVCSKLCCSLCRSVFPELGTVEEQHRLSSSSTSSITNKTFSVMMKPSRVTVHHVPESRSSPMISESPNSSSPLSRKSLSRTRQPGSHADPSSESTEASVHKYLSPLLVSSESNYT